MQKIKSLLNKENSRAYIDFLKHSGFPFTLKVSNYTTEIISDLYNMQFLQSMRSKQCFAAYSKIKSDIKGVAAPDVNKSGLVYFDHNFKQDFFAPSVVNIDLKSAYANALYRMKIIKEPTYKYLQRLNKLDRLASVGMLAGKKYVFGYDGNGKIVSFEKQISATENFFYYAVKVVQDIMFELRAIAGHDYLFTWVDGIYIRGDPEALKAMGEYLDYIEFPYSVDVLENFEVKVVAQKVKLSFMKNGKKKYFNVPAKNFTIATDLINYLTSKDKTHDNFIHEDKERREVPLSAFNRRTLLDGRIEQ